MDARLVHTSAYAAKQSHEVRATLHTIGSVVVIVMADYVLAAAIAYSRLARKAVCCSLTPFCLKGTAFAALVSDRRRQAWLDCRDSLDRILKHAKG